MNNVKERIGSLLPASHEYLGRIINLILEFSLKKGRNPLSEVTTLSNYTLYPQLQAAGNYYLKTENKDQPHKNRDKNRHNCQSHGAGIEITV